MTAAFLLGCSENSSPSEQHNPVRSFILITLDTTRRDALGCYGQEPSPTPNIDRFASGARVFDAARTVTPMTLPSHASMLTGLIPPRHSVRDNSHSSLPTEAVTVAEAAQSQGFRTAAIIAAPVLDPAFGLAQGFDVYDAPNQAEAQRTGRHGGRLAEDVTQRALRFLDDTGQSPFFLWVHYFDPHEAYEPEPRFLELAGGNAYLGEVAQADAAVGALLRALDERGLTESTGVLLTSDHGEALGQHGESTHSAFVYDATLAVPFILKDPRAATPGERVPTPISVVDVAPTIVAALGLPGLAEIDGSDLWRGQPERSQPIYFESLYGAGYFGWSPLCGVLLEGRKYVHSSAPEVFDLGADPAELNSLDDDLFAARAFAVLQRQLELPRLAQTGRSGAGPDLAVLQALGYVGAGLETNGAGFVELRTEGLESPHARAPELAQIRAILGLHSSGQADATIPLLAQLLVQEPNNPTALSLLGQNLRAAGRVAEALPYLERFAQVGPKWPSTWLELARTYVSLGRGEDALDWYERILQEQRSPALAQEIARVFAHLGRAPEGLTWLAERGFGTQRPEPTAADDSADR